MVDTDGADGAFGGSVGIATAGDGAFVPIGGVVLVGCCAGGGDDVGAKGKGAAVTLICSGGSPCLSNISDCTSASSKQSNVRSLSHRLLLCLCFPSRIRRVPCRPDEAGAAEDS